MPKKKPDIMDLVVLAGPEAVAAADKLGWEFLALHGYDVAGWNDESEDVAKATMWTWWAARITFLISTRQ